MFYSLILASTFDGGIGLNNCLPWNIDYDLQLFKKITSESNSSLKKNAVIMGRKTWESIPYKPLRNRLNIIITSSHIYSNNKDVIVFSNIDDAFSYCNNNRDLISKVFVIGGKSLYDLCLNNEKYLKNIKYVYLSLIKDKYKCDTYIDLKNILKKFKYNDINYIIFNSNFIHLKLINNNLISYLKN